MHSAKRQRKKEFHGRAIEKLNAEYAKLQNRIDRIHLDKLDGEIEECFYRLHVTEWRRDQKEILARIERHQHADQNYIEQGIRLLEIARNAAEYYRSRSQKGSTLENDKIIPVFKQLFNIVHALAADARKAAQDSSQAIKNRPLP